MSVEETRFENSPQEGERSREASSADRVDDVVSAEESHFFALLSRLKYINRWALMRSAREETLAEHSLDVAMIAHALCLIGNVRYGHHLDADHAAVMGLYHDASEIITGDMPTPVKYRNGRIRDAYHDVEAEAEHTLLATLPDDLHAEFEQVFRTGLQGDGTAHTAARGYADIDAGVTGTDTADAAVKAADDATYLVRLVKAADKLSALIKCEEELGSGSHEFATAAATTRARLDEMASELPEVEDFMREFLPSYGRTLDELL